jgi:hypothetical protein
MALAGCAGVSSERSESPPPTIAVDDAMAQSTPTSRPASDSPMMQNVESAAEATPVPGDWAERSFYELGVALEFPAHWQPLSDAGNRLGGDDGFVQIVALDSEGWELEPACDPDAGHCQGLYGTEATVELLDVDGREACLIMPSDDQPEDLAGQAGLLVRYMRPDDSGGERAYFLQVWASQEHVRRIAGSVRFFDGAVVAAEATMAGPVYLLDGALYQYLGGDEYAMGRVPDDAAYLTLGPRRLAYVADGRIEALSLGDGEIMTLAELDERPNPDYDLHWSTDGEALVWAEAWSEADNKRQVQLSVVDGDEWRVVDTLVAREAGPAPTRSPMPPADSEPGYANLRILGLDRAQGRLVVTPVGGAERYGWVWVYDVDTGRRVAERELADAESIYDMIISPDLNRLLVVTVDRAAEGSTLWLYSLKDMAAPPRQVAVLDNMYPGWEMVWSPDGGSLAYLRQEGMPGYDVRETLGLDVLDLDTGTTRALPVAGSPEMQLLGWTEDGAALLLERLDSATGARRLLLIDATLGLETPLALPAGANVLGWLSRAEFEQELP